MSSNSNHLPCASKIIRVGDEIAGPRCIYNNASRIAVTAFPMRELANVVFPAGPAVYVLQNHDSVYLGETLSAETRLIKHLLDPAKSFAREALVVTAWPDPWPNKLPVLFLQHRLFEVAQAAGLMNVVNKQTPTLPVVPEDERGTLERYFRDARQAIFDAGCRTFDSAFESQYRTILSATDNEEDLMGAEGAMQIDVPLHPPAGGEYELRYCGLWARGWPEADGSFVVMPGAEFRSAINASAHKIVTTRRKELKRVGALEEIPGSGRERLLVGVRFASSSIAGKVVTGAHVPSSVWVPRPHAQPILVMM
ncbi:hypothetical protein GGD65_007831 [Bradyrhizobium sp. CIR18]|uniref:hypothetical protein n=1 Tax=Bradyrhizobium sp. CIR18 TaxID=2663839 RepID=UPI0016069D8F|nr:hypothetical protein [Bradyrhizobium sp. CIR18]MBB4366757.1 hypothetical protein [Bradyrhizobium sp. CIR18]